MKHRQRLQNIQRDLKDPPRRALRTSTWTRRRHTSPGFSLDPDRDCSVQSVRGAESDQSAPSLPSGVCGNPLANGSPAPSGGDKVQLLDCGEDEVLELDSEETPVTPELVGKVCLSGGPGDGRRAGFDSQLDDSPSEDTATSGPSSPLSISLKCRECMRLFSRVRRQRPPKLTKRDTDPASPSCDNWLLNKAWHPQRQRQVKGRLWVHLKRIRKLAAERANGVVTDQTQGLCSRLHVFMQRNLRHCTERLATVTGASESHVVSRPRRGHRVKSAWPRTLVWCRGKSGRRSLDRPSRVHHLSAQELTMATITTEPGAGSQRQLSGPDAASPPGMQAGGAHLEGTRRALKFDCTPSFVTMETQEPRQELMQEESIEEPRREAPGDGVLMEGDTPPGLRQGRLTHSNGFRSPLELSSVDSRVVRKSQSARTTQNSSFRALLAALEKSRSRIIKETDK
ncbi:uncharacterized protein LOC143528760 [Brachyhypopomus gauderio]|uniref:uncharacterized protein LOC143528760 n=1 Tax=Brachyhypopomus gauderio TaxID=698409 RepID=UPI004041DFED